MLNKNGVRELAWVTKVDNVTPIEGYDRVELAHIGGWTVVVGKNEFKAGDLAVYFEIDSLLPDEPPFNKMDFLVKKHFKVKTQKMCNSISQGLIMRPADFGLTNVKVGDFLTEQLKVTYYVAEDNARKAKVDPNAKLNKALARHPKIAKRYGKYIKNHKFARGLFMLLFGKKRHSDLDEFPRFVSKTDEERVQNIPYILNDKSGWIVTEKIDGTSTTAALQVGKFGRYKFWICSRNVAFGKKKKGCYYEENYYTKMSEKYKFEEVLKQIAKAFNAKTVALQGETFGASVQKRDYGMKNQDFRGFNLYIDGKRLNSIVARDTLAEFGIQWVPILDTNFILPDTVDEMLAYAAGTKSQIDGGMREGVVLRSQDGTKSFKAVSNEFLLKYHG